VEKPVRSRAGETFIVFLRERGSLVSQTGGEAAGYSLENLQNRGALFVGDMTPVYGARMRGTRLRTGAPRTPDGRALSRSLRLY
jgi:predicted membrane GTPase involved in stress response